MSAQRFTVEQIEAMASGCDTRYCSEFRPLPDLAPDYCDFCGEDEERHRLIAMLRAFALQTQRIEQMREWLESERDDWCERRHTVEAKEFGHGVHAEAECALQKFAALFPKDGGQ